MDGAAGAVLRGGLLASIALGSRESFAELYDARRAQTWGLCRRRFADTVEAAAAMELLWLWLWENAPALSRDALSDRDALSAAALAVMSASPRPSAAA